MVMLDLQKAFNTVDHCVLLYTFKAMGFSELAVKWVGSYSGNRMQVVDIGGTMSQPQGIDWHSSRECFGATALSFIY